MSHPPRKHPVVLSIGIMAWNEADALPATLASLFRQTVFARLAARHESAEVIVVANACTDRTAAVARACFARLAQGPGGAEGCHGRVIEIPEAGKANAWNRFIHEFSAVETRAIVSMDADIVFHHRDTIFNLMTVLERRPEVPAATGRQCKDLLFKERKTLRERLSLAATAMGGGEAGKICGQLHCLRADVARNLYLPRDLGATEDGFIKEMVCTDFLTRPADPGRIVLAPDAAHIFEAYVNLGDVLNNQKRQMLGQTTVHVLVEYLKSLPREERSRLAATLRRLEAADPDWLKRLIAAHLRRRRFFWQIFPGILTFRFQRLLRQPGLGKLTRAPAALAGFVVTLVACARASRALRAGLTQYWPKANRQSLAVAALETK